ncbi:MAG: Ig-like domain-containing protein [Lachnospiraceae bacterium]|nr:Ig-like domain-containing protein [Lachnospiraceae bacterium]
MRKKALSLFMAAVMITTTPASVALAGESGTAEAAIVSEEDLNASAIVEDGETSSESVDTEEEPGVGDEETAEAETSDVSDEEPAGTETSGVSDEESAGAETSGLSDEETAGNETSGVSDEAQAEDETSGVSDEEPAEEAVENDDADTGTEFALGTETTAEAGTETDAELDEKVSIDTGISIANIASAEDSQISVVSEDDDETDSGLTYTGSSRSTYIYLLPGEEEEVTLVANATANEGIVLTYQWYDEDWDIIEGATSSEYELGIVEGYSEYMCRVSDPYGNYINLYYYVEIDNALSLSAEQSTYTVELGESVTLSVTAAATDTNGLTYTWSDSDGEYYDADSTDSVTKSSLTLADISRTKTYYCTVRDAYGNSTRVSIRVKINTGLKYNDPNNEDDEGYYSYGVSYGNSLTLEAKAAANDGIELTYQWYCDDGEEVIDGATGSSYTIDSVTARDWYCCKVSDGYGGTLWFDYYVYIDNKLSVNADNSTITVEAGSSATLSVTATATDMTDMTYTWYYYDNNYSYCAADSTSSSLTLENIVWTRTYYCRVTDKYGNSRTVSIRVKIDTGLQYNDPGNDDEGYYSYTVAYGNSLTLEAKAAANDGIELTYQWYYDDGEALIDGATGSSYTVDSVTARDWYYCIVSDGYGGTLEFEYSVRVNAGLTVDYTGSHYIVSGDDVTLEVEASVNAGSVTYRWYEYDEEEDEYILLSDETGSSLALTNVTERGEYYCRVTDDFANYKTAWFYVNLVTSLYVSYNGYVSAITGESMDLTVEAVSPYSPITYQWYVYIDDEGYEALDGETGAALTITPTTGYSYYKCAVGDGETTTDAEFMVDAYTLTLTYDSSLEIEPGGSGTLTVSAASVVENAEITYRWYQYKDGEGYTLLEGENKSSLTVDRPGTYECIVSDSTSTQYAYFEVDMDTGLSASAASSSVLMAEAGSTTELSVSASTNYGELSYLWYNWDEEGSRVTLGTSESLTLTNPAARTYYYYYYCRVSDGYNSKTLTFRVYVVDDLGETATSAGDAAVMTIGTSATALIANGGDYMYFAVTPAESGTYTFYTLTNYDTYGYLYNSNLNCLTSDDDGGTDNNFKITYDLSAGETYYLAVRYYSSSNVGAFTVYSVEGSEIPAQCAHSNVTHVAAVAATCTTAGNIEYWYCSDCGKYYSDSDLTLEVSPADLVTAATGHQNVTHTAAKAATCAATGNIEYWYCADCGKYFSDSSLTKEVSADSLTTAKLTTHTATGTWVTTKAATCTTTGTRVQYCKHCGTSVIVKSETIAATGHTWNSGTVTKAATCAATGVRTYTCTACGATKTETIAKLTTHTATGTWVTTKAATCTATGTRVQYCKHCGTSVIVKSETIAAAGHSWSSWKTKSAATVFSAKILKRTCSVCGKTQTKTSGKKLTATIKFNTTASTIALKKGTSTTALKVTYANGDSIKSVKSSKTSIATVSLSKKGVITIKGKKAGTATITVTLASGKKKSIKVKVQTSTVKTTKITVASKTVSIKKGKTYTLAPVLTPITSTQKITYTSSNKKVATVSSSGKITAKKKGTATITIKSGSKSVKVKVTVN